MLLVSCVKNVKGFQLREKYNENILHKEFFQLKQYICNMYLSKE